MILVTIKDKLLLFWRYWRIRQCNSNISQYRTKGKYGIRFIMLFMLKTGKLHFWKKKKSRQWDQTLLGLDDWLSHLEDQMTAKSLHLRRSTPFLMMAAVSTGITIACLILYMFSKHHCSVFTGGFQSVWWTMWPVCFGVVILFLIYFTFLLFVVSF